ncbi:hypothetical protein [Nocardioides conyzicola]|uniref:DUF4245 domain-containing protein n=1 Tax=Nocardioides conyzicola TaxID=1651781 RepID=A0ABP8XEY7_9ACTN
MRVRWIGLALALVLVGGAVGYAVGRATLEQPLDLVGAEPVPAVSPSYPVNEYVVLPDPGLAPLATGLPLHTAKFNAGGMPMTASVPDGWRRAPLEGRDAWNFAVPENPRNTYLLRVGLVTNRISLKVALQSRINALEDAESNGDLEHLVIESRTDEGFTATYLDNGHQRVSMERWLPRSGSSQAYAAIATTGRETDRAGMADLLERVSASAAY